jgi:hypothetical protein
VGKAPSLAAAVTAGCEHHSYLLGVVLVLVGVTGLLVTGYVATRLAVRYLGAGAVAFLRGGRRMSPMGPRRGPGNAGGFPGGTPRGLSAGPPPVVAPAPPHRKGPDL